MQNTILKETIHQKIELDRVAARVPKDVKKRWLDAATMRGQTLTDFLIVAANNATAEAFMEYEKIELSKKDQIKLAELLLNPPKLSNTMQNALKLQMASMQDV